MENGKNGTHINLAESNRRCENQVHLSFVHYIAKNSAGFVQTLKPKLILQENYILKKKIKDLIISTI